MISHQHRFPMPLWNATEVTITLPHDIAEKVGYYDAIPPGGIVYAPNTIELGKLQSMRERGQAVWSEKAITREFPKALHGPNGQSLTVYDKEEQKRALKNGWSLTPLTEDDPVQLPPSPDRSPLGLEKVGA